MNDDSNSESFYFISKDEIFIVWNQIVAIFKECKNKVAAKLFLSYLSSYEFQSSYSEWITRIDVSEYGNLRLLEELKNVSTLGFTKWMWDRENVKKYRTYLEKIFGKISRDTPMKDANLMKFIKLNTSDINDLPELSDPIYWFQIWKYNLNREL